MTSNNYQLMPASTLETLHLALKDTLVVLSAEYKDLAICPEADLKSFHEAVGAIRQEYDKVNEALKNFNIIPESPKTSENQSAVVTPSEIHY